MSRGILELGAIRAAGLAADRDDAIRESGEVLVAVGAVSNGYVSSMIARERSVSTYMGNFLAIPHGTNDAKGEITRSAVSVVRYSHPIDWDGNEVRFAVGIAGIGDEHLDVLAKFAVVFSDPDEVQRLLEAEDAAAIYAIMEEVNAE